jgi:hypothetical protein
VKGCSSVPALYKGEFISLFEIDMQSPDGAGFLKLEI